MPFAKLERRPELDALRGLFILLMVSVHLPTRLGSIVDQPFGYISAAEGFVSLSAVLVGRIFFGEFLNNAAKARIRIWRRTLRVYAYHLVLLGLAFTVAASYAAEAHRPAILNLLHFYFLHPAVAIAGSLLLLYCPPLLDILPLYVIFMFLTPFILLTARRIGWKWVLAASASIWAGAQFGLRAVVYGWLCAVLHLRIPLRETGAFNLLAWQVLWVAGLWLGARSAEGEFPLDRIPQWTLILAFLYCGFFLAVRHGWLGPRLAPDAFGLELDKWRMAPLRAVNIAAFIVVAWRLRRYFVHLIAHEPLLTIGKVSLQVFCAHLFFVFTGLALLAGDHIYLHGARALVLIAVTFPALTAMAYWLEISKRHKARNLQTAPSSRPIQEYSSPTEADAGVPFTAAETQTKAG